MDNFRNRGLNPNLDDQGIRAKLERLWVRCGNCAFRHMQPTLVDSLAIPNNVDSAAHLVIPEHSQLRESASAYNRSHQSIESPLRRGFPLGSG
jgi:hypothetical protein